MEAQAIFSVKVSGALQQENASRGLIDVFQTLLRENETRDLARRGEAPRTEVPRDRVEREAERSASARYRSDAVRETRSEDRYNDDRYNDDRYNDTRDERPEADDIPTTDRVTERERPDEPRPRSDQSADPAATEADPQARDGVPIASDTPVETGPGDKGTLGLATPIVAAEPALAGNPAITVAAPTQVTHGVTAQAATATNLANPKDAASNVPRPAVVPATVASSPATLNGAAVAPVVSDSKAAATSAPAAAKILQSALPVVPGEAGIPLNAEQIKRIQASGQKTGAAATSSKALEIVETPDKENRAPTAAKFELERAGDKNAAKTPSLVTNAEVNQAARPNPALVPPSSGTPGQQPPVTRNTATDALKTAASSGNTGQAPAGLTGIDPMQVAARAAGSRPGSAPAADRPIPPNEVAVTIQRAAARGDDRIRIRLHPAELGQVDVRLKVGADGIVRAMVQVERPETLDILQRDARGLERALQDAGLKTDSGSLSFNLRDNGKDGLQDRDADTAMTEREETDADSSAAEAAEIPIHTGWSNRVLDIRV